MESSTYSWKIGPSNSFLLRTLGYLGYSWIPAFLLVTLYSLYNLNTLGLSHLVLFLLIALIIGIIMGGIVIFQRSMYHDWVVEEFNENSTAIGFTIGFIINSIILCAIRLSVGWHEFVLIAAFMINAIIISLHLIRSKGRILVNQKELEYNGEQFNLECLQSLKRLEVGHQTVLFLVFRSNRSDHPSGRGLFLLPTETLENGWSAFKAGLETDVVLPKSNDANKTVILIGILIFFVGGVILVLSPLLVPIPATVVAVIATLFCLIGLLIILSETWIGV